MRPSLLSRVPCAALLMFSSASAFAWGAQGHESVGAIADQIVKGTVAGSKVQELLNGIGLQQAAVWADCAKGVVPSKNYAYAPSENYAECKIFETDAGKAEMSDYVRRNDKSCALESGESSCHKEYHYTDVAVQHDAYETGLVGTRDDDVVQAIAAATLVLKGQPAPPPFNIKDEREALLLIAHFVGDLHQPLHVGAIYLDKKGRRVNPDKTGYDKASNTRGGNEITVNGTKLHAKWDDIPAALHADKLPDNLIAKARVLAESASGSAQDWPVQWAGESIQAAQSAFRGIKFAAKQSGTWKATLPANYTHTMTTLKQEQIVRGGAHLAQLLREVWP